MILAIDPGNIESAYVLMDEDLKPVEFGKFTNGNVRCEVRRLFEKYMPNIHIVIEMVASYGMAVGKEVFETCVWIGRFYEVCGTDGWVSLMYRKDVKMNLCHTMKAKDGNIIQALVDRFAPNTRNKGKGVKANPGWFYGFKADIWQAYAVGVTDHDIYLRDYP